MSLTSSEVTSGSVNATTKARETPSNEDNKALEETKKTKEKVEEGDKSDEEEAAKTETLETWSSSSFFSSASPEDLLKLVSGQSSPKSTRY